MAQEYDPGTSSPLRQDESRAAPFFSVVIPTRNRPEYLADAVRSILEQTFTDFELIVSDNSDQENAERNRAMLRSIGDDPRLRYIRPERELPMVAHWEWAFQFPRGRYYGVVTDRMALRLYTLETLHEILVAAPTPAICYKSQRVTEAEGYRALRTIRRAARPVVITSRDMIARFSRSELGKDNPRMLNSFVDAAVFKQIRAHHGTAFTGISPDYSFMFRLLDQVDSYTYVPLPLLVVQGEERSNGRAFKTGKFNAESRDFLAKIKSDQGEWLQYGPLKGDPFFISNAMLREYEIVASQSSSGRYPPVDPSLFYERAKRDAAELVARGNYHSDAVTALEEFRSRHNFAQPKKSDHAALYVRRRVRDLLPTGAIRRPALRFFVDGALRRLKLGSRVSAGNVMEVLRKDAALRRAYDGGDAKRSTIQGSFGSTG